MQKLLPARASCEHKNGPPGSKRLQQPIVAQRDLGSQRRSPSVNGFSARE